MHVRTASARKAFSVALLSAALGGCMGTFSSADRAGPDLARLAETGSGVLVAHTSLHDGCREVTAALAKGVVSGRSIDIGRTVTLKSRSDPATMPGYAVLPAGEYGIVRFTCEGRGGTRVFAAPTVEHGSNGDGIGTVYAAPLVTFRVGPGEIVDAGSVRLTGRPDEHFSVSVAKMPEAWLQNLPSAYSALSGARVVRPMTVPGRRERAEIPTAPQL
jgi:hypothetical protein